jgi:hypothetical protein
MPPAVAENFKNSQGDFEINYNFAGELTLQINAVFQKNAAPLGIFNCIRKKNKTKIIGNVEGMKIFGFELLNLECEIDNQKNMNINLNGHDFNVASLLKIDQHLVEKFELKSSKGTLKSSKPFFMGKECSFDFDFKELDFWNRIIPIAGSGSGNLTYKDGKISGKGNFPKLFLQKSEFTLLNFSVTDNNFQITAQDANTFNMKLTNIDLKIIDRHFNLRGKLNQNGILEASGDVAESFKKIFLKKGEIRFPNHRITLEDSLFDASTNTYKINCALIDKKKMGEMKIDCNHQVISGDFESFPLDKLLLMFNCHMPSCRLGGNLKLKTVNGCFIGNGKLSLSNFVAHKRSLELNLNFLSNGTQCHISANRQNDFLNVSSFIPIVFKSNGGIHKNLQSNLLDFHMTANTSLEKMFELSDNLDLRGNLDCDFRIGGSLANATISGKVKLNKIYLAIGNILLKNGTISLEGNNGQDILVHGKFTDSQNKNMMISGTGKLFFDDFIPNIDVNIRLMMNNFKLFDAENLKIVVNGPGLITGLLNDITISGDVVIPRCEIQKFATVEEKLDLEFENDNYLNTSNKPQLRNNFFKYNVSMRCDEITLIGKNFEIHLSGNLLLSTHQNIGTLIGNLGLIDGKLDLFGKRLNFVEGNVTFLEDFPFDPKASFRCSKNLGDLLVELEVKNNPKKGATLNLHSTPNYTQDVILSRMLFGKETKYLTVGEAAQLANAMASLKQKGYIFSILNTFQNVGIIDNISFVSANDNQSSALYTNHQNTTKKGNTNISAGKYINDNVYISVNKKGEQTSFDVDFSITPRISIKANSLGEAGISWKYRY